MGSVLCVDDQSRCVGIITDRHIAVQVVGAGGNADMVRIREVMTRDPVMCHENHNLADAAHLCMRKGPFRRMPVVNDENRVVGIVSVADLALLVHPAIDAILAETEASVGEAKVQQMGEKQELQHRVEAVSKRR